MNINLFRFQKNRIYMIQNLQIDISEISLKNS